jgi:hypothetical protein
VAGALLAVAPVPTADRLQDRASGHIGFDAEQAGKQGSRRGGIARRVALRRRAACPPAGLGCMRAAGPR